MHLRINGVDLLAAKAKYHRLCRVAYVNKRNCESTVIESELHVQWVAALNLLFNEIDTEIILKGCVVEISTLTAKMNQLLEEHGILESTSMCNNKKLKSLLTDHYGNKLAFQNPNDRRQSQLVYSGDMNVGEAVTSLKELNDSFNDSLLNDSFDSNASSIDVEGDDQAAILHRAALILRAELDATKGLENWPPLIGDISDENAETMISALVRDFLQLMLIGTVSPDSNNPSGSTQCRILSIAQDLLFVVSKGRKMTPKHIALGNAIHHLSRNKSLLTMVNRFGHCISHDQVMRINTAVANQLQVPPEDITIPECIQPNTFTQIAADNNDLLEETIDGKNTTHCTNMVVIQRPEHIQVPGQFSSRVCPTTRRDRSLGRISQPPIKMHRFGKRVSPHGIPFDIDKVKHLSDFLQPLQMDAAWLLARSLQYHISC